MFLDLMTVFVGLIILWRIDTMSTELARLQAEVTEMSTVAASAVALIEGLSAQIRDNANDPAALTALADSLDDSGNKLAAAVAANTAATVEGEAEEVPAEDLEPIEETPADTTGAADDTTGTGPGGTANE